MNTEQNHLSKTQLLSYGWLAAPLAMLGIPLYIYLPNYYSETYGLGLASIGIALLAARVFDGVTDLFIGWLSDRYRFKIKRAWQIVFGIFILLLAVFQLFFPSTSNINAYYLFFWSFITYLAWTVIQIPYHALVAEITTASFAKSQLTATREGLSLLGAVFILILPVILSKDIYSLAFYQYFFLSLLISIALAALLILRVKTPDCFNYKTNTLNPWATLKGMWQEDKSIFQIMPIYFINNLANALPATLFIIFIQGFLDLDEHLGLLLIAYFIAGVLSLPVWLKLSKNIGKVKTWNISLVLAAVFFSGIFLLDKGSLYGFLAITLLTGLSLGVDLAIPSSIQADLAQKTSLNSSQKSGIIFGIWGMITKLSLAFAIGIAFPLIELAEVLNINSNITLLILYAALPIGLKVYAAIKLSKIKLV